MCVVLKIRFQEKATVTLGIRLNLISSALNMGLILVFPKKEEAMTENVVLQSLSFSFSFDVRLFPWKLQWDGLRVTSTNAV